MKTITSSIEAVLDAVPLILEAASGVKYTGRWEEDDDFNPVHSDFTLDQMSDGCIAEDNCHYTTDFLFSSSLLDLIEAPHIQSKAFVQCEYGQNHIAVLLQFPETGENIVLDFTARQYSQEADFPMVAKQSEWFEFVKQHIDGTNAIMETLSHEPTVRW